MDDIRKQFPLFESRPNDVYLDNAATTQKPISVLQAIRSFYAEKNSNVHRSNYPLSDLATTAFEHSRATVARFLNAPKAEEIIFTRGTTEAINLVASSYGGMTLKSGDEVLITEMEHHSNIVPWQLVCERSGTQLRAARVRANGELDIEHFESLLSDRTKIVALTHVSNALGTINPIASLIAKAHDVGAAVLVDGAQAASHVAIDVQALDCDFYAISGHKMYSPLGIGALYARESLLGDSPPWQGGGEMIEEVRIERTTYQKMPYRFEAGTPNVGGAIAMGASIEFMDTLDRTKWADHEEGLLDYATRSLKQTEGITLIGEAKHKVPIVSFNVDGLPHSDVGTLLGNQGIAVRSGHHCAMPLMASLGVAGTVRASFAVYNSLDEVDKLMAGIEKARNLLQT